MSFKAVSLQAFSMKKQNFGRHFQLGFSVVELMVAGFLGLILIGGVVQLFLSSNQSYRTQDDLATLQEDGRLALMFLKEQIQPGGYIISLDADPVLPITFGADASIDSTADEISVSYEGEVASGNNFDCNGVAVLDGALTNRFYVEDNQLLCKGNGAGSVAQPLIDGVEDFQVLYGVEDFVPGVLPGCRLGIVNRYLNATQVVAESLTERVLSVKVGLLLVSSSNVLPEAEKIEYQLLDKTVTVNDRLGRRIFQQTIFMPNSIHSAASNPSSLQDCSRPFT